MVKQLLKKLFVSATVALFCLSSTTASADIARRSIGFCVEDEYPYQATGISFTNDVDLGVAVRIPADMLSQYAGGKIVGIKMICGDGALQAPLAVDFFLRQGSFDSKNSSSGKAELDFGWNEIYFDEPYMIPSEVKEPVNIGFYAHVPANTYYVYCTLYGRFNEGVNFVTEHIPDGDEIWDDLINYRTTGYENNFSMLAIVEVDDEGYRNMVSVNRVVVNNIGMLGNISRSLMYVNNVGFNDISSMELTYRQGEKTSSINVNFDSNPIKGGAKDVAVSIPFEYLGSGYEDMAVTKVNGEPNNMEETDYTSKEYVMAVPEDVAGKYTKRPLVEFFCSESDHSTPRIFKTVFEPAFEPYRRDVTFLSQHMADQFMTNYDENTGYDDATRMAIDMANGDRMAVYLPQMALDRTDQSMHPHINASNVAFATLYDWVAQKIYDEQLSVPTFASIDINPRYDESTRTANIKVSGHIADGVLPEGEKLSLAVFVVEDDIVSDAQEMPEDEKFIAEFCPDGYYHQDGVIRMQPTPFYGVEVEEGDYSMEFPIELESKRWDDSKMRVVALLQRPQSNGYRDRDVINTNEVALKSSGIRDIVSATGENVEITVADGTVFVNGSTENVTVYTLNGSVVPNKGLRNGLYIVSSPAGHVKVAVK